MLSIENVLDQENLNRAYAQVVGNKGAAGIDEMSVDNLGEYLVSHGENLLGKIRKGTYKPSAVRRVEIPKPSGGVRLLGIPTVVDRMIQQAIGQELSKHYDPGFSEYSYGFRAGRSCHDAIDTALDYLNAGHKYVVSIDLAKFFDRVNHDRLMYALSMMIKDKELLRLIRKYLQSGVMINGVVQRTEEGTPQGGNLSPILSNIVLDELDKELEKRGHKFVRYADDISIFVRSRRSGERVLESISNFIESRLKLQVNAEKSGVYSYTKVEMLGFGFYKDTNSIEPRILTKSYQRFHRKLKQLTSRKWPISFDNRMKKLHSYIMGWVNYYGKAKGLTKMKQTDKWLRRRLRMCIWKQWKKGSKRMRSLIRLGVSKQQAYKWSNTRKGYWRTSGSPILDFTITNDRLAKRGYTSIEQAYRRRHSILMNRRGTRPVCQVV